MVSLLNIVVIMSAPISKNDSVLIGMAGVMEIEA
jgi:hypothetical protein